MTLEYMRIKNRESRARVRKKVLNLLGNKCVNCKHSDERVLQVDHINRAKVPRNSYIRSGTGLYFSILKGKIKLEELQLLCANCNFLKKLCNKEF